MTGRFAAVAYKKVLGLVDLEREKVIVVEYFGGSPLQHLCRSHVPVCIHRPHQFCFRAVWQCGSVGPISTTWSTLVYMIWHGVESMSLIIFRAIAFFSRTLVSLRPRAIFL